MCLVHYKELTLWVIHWGIRRHWLCCMFFWITKKNKHSNHLFGSQNTLVSLYWFDSLKLTCHKNNVFFNWTTVIVLFVRSVLIFLINFFGNYLMLGGSLRFFEEINIFMWQRCIKLIRNNNEEMYKVTKQPIIIISGGSCDTEDWSNDAELCFVIWINCIFFKYSHREHWF